MAFWKKSDDPWDIDPEKRKKKTEATWLEQEPPAREETGAAPEKQGERLGDTLKNLFKKKEEGVPIVPEKCPWCGKEMTWGCIVGGRDTVHWQNWKPKGLFNLSLAEDQEQYDLMDEGGLLSNLYKTAWRCKDCGKLVMNFAPERTAAEVEEIYRKPTGYEEQINAWGANPKAYEDYQTQWKEEETT